MLELIREASTTQFVALIVALVCGIMVILQALINRRVYGPYLIGFFGASVVLLASLR